MTGYVDRQKIIERSCTGCTMHGPAGECYNADPCERLIEALQKAPAVDAASVVRCKDCAAYGEITQGSGRQCLHLLGLRFASPDDFCSNGWRQEDHDAN